MGYFEKNMKIRVLYRGSWHYASSIDIATDGNVTIEHCHGLYGCIDMEHVDKIVVGVKKK